MPKTVRFVDAFRDQQVDVLEKEVRAIRVRNRAGLTSRGNISRLLENPGIPQRATADEDAGNRAAVHAVDDVRRLDAVSARVGADDAG